MALNETRTDDYRTDSPRPATIAELYERSVRASREAWKSGGELAAPAPVVRDEAAASGVRVDVASIPKIADLQARHAAAALVAWRTNPGDGVRGPVSR